MQKPRLTRIAAAATLIGAGTFSACSSSDDTPPPLPEGPPALSIATLSSPGATLRVPQDGSTACFAVGPSTRACSNDSKSPACSFVVELGTDGSGQIPLELPDGSVPRSWTFAAPLGCQGAPDCGFAVLLIDPTSAPCSPKPQALFWKVSAGPSIPVTFSDLHDQVGPKKVRVELWPAEGFPDQAHCEAHDTAEVTIDFELSCSGTGGTDGGSPDGSRDAAVSDGGRDATSDASDASADASTDATDARAHDAAGSDGSRSDGSRGDASSIEAGSDAKDAAQPTDAARDGSAAD